MKTIVSILLSLFILSACLPSIDENNEVMAKTYLDKIEKEVSKRAVDDLIIEITTQFELQNLNAINKHFDYNALISRGLIKSNKDISQIKDISQGVSTMEQNNPMLKNIQNSFTYYDFVKQYTDKDGYTVVVFRGYGMQGLNYHEYVLGTVNDELKIIDVFIILNGAYLSVTLMDFMSDMFQENVKNKDVISYSEHMKTATQLMLSEDYESAYYEFQKIPQEVRDKSQLLSFFEIQILIGYDEELYVQKLEDYRIKFPDNAASVNLASIDYFIIKKQFDKALSSLDKLKKNYPNDPIIDFLIGNTYLQMNECENAVEYCKMSVENAPNILELQDGLLAVYFECEKYEDGFNLASELIEENYFSISDFENYLFTLDFTYESWPSYQKWSTKY
jgi:tetratricopeptide (TPR) repeat protein